MVLQEKPQEAQANRARSEGDGFSRSVRWKILDSQEAPKEATPQ